MRIISDWQTIEFSKILAVYQAVNWTNYTQNPESLKEAFKNTNLVLLALDENEKVIGVLRSISDNVSIHYLQDILVHPDSQRNGVGRALLVKALENYSHVRSHMLLTDDDISQKRFYESLGYKNTKELKKFSLNSFLKMKDVDLE